jgi:predicted regulator of Ras-like GTPase activity (Roadblock/LC7/MglB family)
VLIEAERSHLPSGRIEIVDQDALQAVFMTEEMLSIDRVVELCGALPGIKSCILAHGAAVLSSHNVPESIDLVSLSAHALEMLAAMRQSAARMGIGAVPAVTIHAEKGPITFFHQDDLCLLVMHKDRGFVPGVREKLQKVVEHLAQSDPAMVADDSRLRWAAKKPAG